MRTQLLGTIDMDQARLDEDLAKIDELEFGEPYIEFNCGNPWKSCMIWTVGGETGDGVLSNYDTAKPCLPTEYGRQLPYISEFIEQFFAVEHLLFARLTILNNNVLVPHRDYLELADRPDEQRASHRFHIPLDTSENCLFMDGNTIYRMRVGEVWSLDVTNVHSAAVLSHKKRVHLILDFAEVEHKSKLSRFDINPSGIPHNNRIARPVLSESERDTVLALSNVIDLDNLWDVFDIVVKKEFRTDGGENYTWKTMREIGALSGNPEVHARIEKFHQHSLLERSE